jgi:hypothetical protein
MDVNLNSGGSSSFASDKSLRRRWFLIVSLLKQTEEEAS